MVFTRVDFVQKIQQIFGCVGLRYVISAKKTPVFAENLVECADAYVLWVIAGVVMWEVFARQRPYPVGFLSLGFVFFLSLQIYLRVDD